MHGGSAAPGAGADRFTVHGLDEGFGQAGGGAVLDPAIIVVQQYDGAQASRKQSFDIQVQFIQDGLQGHIPGDVLQDIAFGAQQILRPQPRVDIRFESPVGVRQLFCEFLQLVSRPRGGMLFPVVMSGYRPQCGAVDEL